jgi:glycosyltransferase involved in cell wall biosynthesis
MSALQAGRPYASKESSIRITFVLWNGDIGGAERVTAAIAGKLRRTGIDAVVMFVRGPGLLAAQLSAERVPHTSLGLARGWSVILNRVRMQAAMQQVRPDVVVTVRVGYLGAALRASGFRGPIIGIEWGELIELHQRRELFLKGWATRAVGVVTHDAEVAVSGYMVDLASRGLHARRIVPIALGVEPGPSAVELPSRPGSTLTAGYVGRLYPGKGVDRLIRAIAVLARTQPANRVELLVAGDGEMRGPWTQLAHDLGVADRVQFMGWTDDVRDHWARCHIAVAPNDTFVESFGMSVLEAMAAGRATIVTDRGALPELVVAEQTGQIVPAGDEAALAAALAEYQGDPERVASHGAAARQRAVANYSLTNTARQFVALATDLLDSSSRHHRGACRRRFTQRSFPVDIGRGPGDPG